ncbi:MAG TPA: beta-aspartyl-peptidase [Gammaproteobacteria bacterium]|nr:beta-aspartyl-peptidase [Gammaproteobacteria bacterium]
MLHRLNNLHLFAPESLGLVNILVAAGKIVAISKDKIQIDKKLLASDEDFEGKRCIPGLIDGHAHITGGGGEAGFKTKVPPLPLSKFTQAGVTSVIGLLGTDDTTRNISSLVAQVYALREEGLSAWCYTGGYHVPPQTLTGSVRKDIVHIEPIIGVGELALSDHRSSQPTFDEIARIVGDAHVAGIMTGKAGIVHFHLGDGERGLDLIEKLLRETELPPRAINPTHCNRKTALFEQACELTKKGITIDVTAFPPSGCDDEYSAVESFKMYHEKNLDKQKFTISSDGGGCLPYFDKQGELLHLDYASSDFLSNALKELLDEGIAESDVLPAFTSNVASLLKLQHKGSIKIGNDADLVILDEGNNIESVMALGKWHQKNHKTIAFGSFE